MRRAIRQAQAPFSWTLTMQLLHACYELIYHDIYIQHRCSVELFWACKGGATRHLLPYQTRYKEPVLASGDVCLVSKVHIRQRNHIITVSNDEYSNSTSIYVPKNAPKLLESCLSFTPSPFGARCGRVQPWKQGIHSNSAARGRSSRDPESAKPRARRTQDGMPTTLVVCG